VKPLPSKQDLDIMWSAATSGALETGTRPHHRPCGCLIILSYTKTLDDYPRNQRRIYERF